MAITITDQYKLLFIKWTILVWLNAAFSFYFYIAVSKNTETLDILGIIFGVFTFVGIYTVLDYYLIKINATKLSASIFNAVYIKALTQFVPMIEMTTGMLSCEFIENTTLDNIHFTSTYLITMTDGILLSIVVVLFMLIAKFITFIIRRFKYKNTQSIDN
jgi:hypothetical protein